MTENMAGRGEGLAGLRELLAKATPQPWNKFIANWDDRLNGYTIPGAVVRGTEAEDCPPDLQAAIFSTTGPRAHADAELIVAAVNYVRAALEAAAPPSTGPHTFTGSDGTGKCCSCGWLCAGGLRNTCEAEWETHVAMAALATPSPQTPRKCSCDPETGRRDPDCKVCAATQEQPAGSAMDGIRRRLQEFAGRLHRPGCPLRLALSDDFVKGWDAAKAHCAERIESILRNYPDGGSPRKVGEDGAEQPFFFAIETAGGDWYDGEYSIFGDRVEAQGRVDDLNEELPEAEWYRVVPLYRRPCSSRARHLRRQINLR